MIKPVSMLSVLRRSLSPPKIRKGCCQQNGYTSPNLWVCFWGFSTFPQ